MSTTGNITMGNFLFIAERDFENLIIEVNNETAREVLRFAAQNTPFHWCSGEEPDEFYGFPSSIIGLCISLKEQPQEDLPYAQKWDLSWTDHISDEDRENPTNLLTTAEQFLKLK